MILVLLFLVLAVLNIIRFSFLLHLNLKNNFFSLFKRISVPQSCKVVAIAGNFSRPSSGQRVLAANQNLILYQRGVRAEFFSGKRRETILYKGTQNDGLINCCTWRDSFIAFTNETGTRIYDLFVVILICFIKVY